MEVFEAILTRRSVRSYLDVPIPKDIISDILLAGQMAPSSGNVQNCKFILIDDEDVKHVVSTACFRQDWMVTAPLFLVIVAEKTQLESMYGKRGVENYLLQNGAAICQNMLLMAKSKGVDSCWVSAFNEQALHDALSIPSNFTPVAVLTFGYGAEKPLVPSRHSLNSFVFFNEFGSKYTNINWIFKNYAQEITSQAKRGIKAGKETSSFVFSDIKTVLQKHVDSVKSKLKKSSSNASSKKK